MAINLLLIKSKINLITKIFITTIIQITKIINLLIINCIISLCQK